jgi:histone H3/H4
MAKKKFAFAWSPLRRLMKESGAEIVSKEAVETLLFYLEDRSLKITKMALKFAKHSKRKKITTSDMELAVDYL